MHPPREQGLESLVARMESVPMLHFDSELVLLRFFGQTESQNTKLLFDISYAVRKSP